MENSQLRDATTHYVARQIRAARELAELTQESLGDLLGLTGSAIANYENGRRGVDVADIIRIARATRQPLSFFLPPQGAAVEGEAELVDIYRRAEPDVRNYLLAAARAFAKL